VEIGIKHPMDGVNGGTANDVPCSKHPCVTVPDINYLTERKLLKVSCMLTPMLIEALEISKKLRHL
jgi:hypothetical protein